MDRVRQVEASQLKKTVPQFEIGDTVEVSVRLVEGDRERIQVFTGTVIARKGSGLRETCTVRRIVQGEGVERVFTLHSPFLTDITVVRQGRVRRSKLYYLRDRVGKRTRVKERRYAPRRKPPEAQAENTEG